MPDPVTPTQSPPGKEALRERTDPFPLPLSTTESFFLSQCANTRTPFVFRVRMRFDGVFNREAALQAFEIAIARHPLLRACVAGQGRDRRWEAAPKWPGLKFAEVASEQIEHIDISREAGLRAVISPDPEATASQPCSFFDIDFHHACSDGQGTRAWIADWCLAYTSLVQGTPVDLKPLLNSKLPDRGKVDAPPWIEPISGGEGMRNLWTTIRGRSSRVKKRPVEDSGDENLVDIVFDVEQTKAVRTALEANGDRLNDVALAMTFALLNKYVTGGNSRQITLLNPVDIRLPSDMRLPACNRLGLSYLRRPRHLCGSVSDVLPSIAEQTRYIKDRYVGAEFIKGLEIVRDRPTRERLFRALGWFVPTALFTCLGDTTRGSRIMRNRNDAGQIQFADVVLQSISGFAPLGPSVPIAACACETLDRLTFTVRTSRNWFDDSQTEAIGQWYRAAFLEYAKM